MGKKRRKAKTTSSAKKKAPVRKKNPELASRVQDCFRDAVEHFNENGDFLGVAFPTGHIRPLSTLSQRWPYLSKARARTVACTIQLCDVNRFLLNMFTVSLTAGAMWEWHVTVPVIAVIEALCYEVVQKEKWASPDVQFKKCIDILHSKGIFKHPFQEKLHQLREYRNNIHLHIHEHVQMADERPEKHNKAVIALHKVERRLNDFYRC